MTGTSPTPKTDWIGPELRGEFIRAWARFEQHGDAEELVGVTAPAVRRRCEGRARLLGLDAEDFVGETNAALVRRHLPRHQLDRLTDDNHRVGVFGMYVDRAMLDAARVLGRCRKKHACAANLGETAAEALPAQGDAIAEYIEQESRRHALASLRLCQQQTLRDDEALAVDLAWLQPVPPPQREIAQRLRIGERALRKRLRTAEEKLRRCLHRRGVRL